MARLTSGDLVFPTAYPHELRVGCVRESLELVFVTVFTGLTADVVLSFSYAELDLSGLSKLSGAIGTEPGNRTED